MSQLAEARYPHRSAQYVSQSHPAPVWPGRPAKLRSAAESMLRDLAFVYHVTRSVRESMRVDGGSRSEASC